MADLRGQKLKDSYQNVVTDSGSDLAGIENGNGVDITARIVERGSNSDGEFVRFTDGTQICIRTDSRDFSTVIVNFDLPSIFTSGNNFAHYSVTQSTGTASTAEERSKMYTYATENRWETFSGSTQGVLDICLIAIGRWK